MFFFIWEKALKCEPDLNDINVVKPHVLQMWTPSLLWKAGGKSGSPTKEYRGASKEANLNLVLYRVQR